MVWFAGIFITAYVALYTMAVIACTMLLLYRRTRQPILFRCPPLVALSSVGAHILFVWVAVYIYCKHDDSVVCDNFFCDPEYNWIVTLGYACLVIPYLLRGARVWRVLMSSTPPTTAGSTQTNMQTFQAPYWDRFIWSDIFLCKVCAIVFVVLGLIVCILELVGINIGFYGYGCKDSVPIATMLATNLVEVFACIALIYSFRGLKDDFGISFEMSVLAGLWFASTVLLFVIAALGRGGGITANTFLDINAICVGIRSTGVFLFSVALPLYQSYQDDMIALPSTCASLQSLENLLTDLICINYFRQYLDRESAGLRHGNYVMLYLEIELFNDIDMKEEKLRVDTAANMISRYLQKDGDAFVPVSRELLAEVERNHSKNGEALSRGIFMRVQNEVFQRMEDEFLRFLKSPECSQLIAQLSHEENLAEVLRKSGMLDSLPLLRGGVL